MGKNTGKTRHKDQVNQRPHTFGGQGTSRSATRNPGNGTTIPVDGLPSQGSLANNSQAPGLRSGKGRKNRDTPKGTEGPFAGNWWTRIRDRGEKPK